MVTAVKLMHKEGRIMIYSSWTLDYEIEGASEMVKLTSLIRQNMILKSFCRLWLKKEKTKEKGSKRVKRKGQAIF